MSVQTSQAESSLTSVFSRMRAHVFRLKPGQDFMNELMLWAKKNKIKATSIVSVVGTGAKKTPTILG